MANVPEAVVIPELLVDLDEPRATRLRALATETIDDWHDAAAGFAGLGRTFDLIAAATGGEGLTEADRRELAARYAELVGRARRVRLSAAELAERTSPLLRLDLETQLTAMDAWPAERGAHLPLYARALLSAWTELTSERPPGQVPARGVTAGGTRSSHRPSQAAINGAGCTSSVGGVSSRVIDSGLK